MLNSHRSYWGTEGRMKWPVVLRRFGLNDWTLDVPGNLWQED